MLKSAGPYIEIAKRNGTRVIFDTDDLVFDPSVVERSGGYKLLNEQQKKQYRDGVDKYRALALRCDAMTVSTTPLATAGTALGLKVSVIPNSWNAIQRAVSDKIIAEPRSSRSAFVIGYFSGSRTHDYDFAEVASNLLALMDAYPDIRLRIVGLLELGPEWKAYLTRVERLPFQPYQKMLATLRECDVNIVPLEQNNAFNEAKSELKWFEAALVEVPTIATPTEPFRQAISDGIDGFLASSKEAWNTKIERLYQDRSLGEQIGRAARAAALSHFGPDIVAKAAQAAYGLPAAISAPTVAKAWKDRKKIDWIIPGLILGGGGHRNILRAAYFLERFGHDVALHFVATEQSSDELKYLVNKHFYAFEGNVDRYDGIGRFSDVLFATHWSTVDAAFNLRGMTQEIMYFVQDFEPMFTPMGTEYILAENTYRRGLYCITSGPWCERILKRDFGAEADSFQFPVDRSVYYPRTKTKTNRNVVFFAKPEMPRRCFELGAMMLRHFHALAPDVEIVMFGSSHVDVDLLGFPATIRSLVPTLDGLAQIYSDADIGIAFSTTNPSLVPYEIMACGTPVVDLGRPGNEANYADRFDLALLADPDPAQMAEQIFQLLHAPEDLEARSKAGLEFVGTFPDEEQMARRVEDLILTRLSRR